MTLRASMSRLARQRHFTTAASTSPGWVGAPNSKVTSKLHFYYPHRDETPPCYPSYRLIDDDGVPLEGAVLPDIPDEMCIRMQETMVRVNEFDKVFNDAQRQGRLSFYFTNRGEEACSVGSGAALHDRDWVWPQYRELGATFWRGYSIEAAADQCCHNEKDRTKGRQLPMHIGSADLNLMYVKSNLGQQVPAANGAAYAMKLMKKDRCAITYFGEGCAQEGDISSALNIAAVHGCPTIFFCRNNGYAISTHTDDQYASDGIVPRGVAFGMPAIRIDGNDLLAVYAATQRAREIAIKEGRPTLIEAMTYRIGAHSTSDDDSKYRRSESPDPAFANERAFWEARSPIIRFGRYLESRGLWSAEREEELRKVERARTIKALNDAEKVPQPHPRDLFTDVYDEPNWLLEMQQAQLKDHLQRYASHYPDMKPEHVESL
uniref:2-oxoisovalerate dehydrogenase subunit alpha n=1 Tax=Coccolithus braarudii TaxID=221442 RepID=A0A7S0LCF9_9EUKA|mmetsp:Transcript_33234/g.71020  ORF Transcript_33234/g.71020 Transcript_33234/m.71020 type:complete len:433 (+) Transcript_33234:123-1421(+)